MSVHNFSFLARLEVAEKFVVVAWGGVVVVGWWWWSHFLVQPNFSVEVVLRCVVVGVVTKIMMEILATNVDQLERQPRSCQL